jgi:hypothetical protein
MVGFLQTRSVKLLFTLCGYLPIQTPFLSAALSFLLHVLYRQSNNPYEVFDLVRVGANGLVVLVAAPATFAATKCHPVHAVSRGQDDFLVVTACGAWAQSCAIVKLLTLVLMSVRWALISLGV